MHFPKFWAKAEHQGFLAWEWSDSNQRDAELKAQESAQRIFQARSAAHASQKPSQSSSHSHDAQWYYSSRPLREEVIEELRSGGREPFALITRNSLGSLILNTARIAFIDIDTKEVSKAKQSSRGLISFLSSIFGSKKPAVVSEETPVSSQIERIKSWFATNRSHSGRLYKTYGGYRILLTDQEYEPDGRSISEIFEQLNSDPLYIRLCKNQKSFRARLTPKSWRCDVAGPHLRWPRTDAQQQEFERWEKHYSAACEQFATCQLIQEFGKSSYDREIEKVVSIHDSVTKAASGLPLA